MCVWPSLYCPGSAMGHSWAELQGLQKGSPGMWDEGIQRMWQGFRKVPMVTESLFPGKQGR